MKNVLIITLIIGFFTATAFTVNAQTTGNTERIDDKVKRNISPKFIEDKDISTLSATNSSVDTNKPTKSNESPINPPSFYKPGYVANIELCTSLQFKYAMLMDTEVESITNLPLYSFIENWWATRYKYGGADRDGIDCSSFTCKLLSEVYGLTAPRTAKEQFTKCEKIATEALVEGNLVFFNISGGVSHVGLYLGNNYFVHSSVNGGVTISSLTEEYYNKKFISGGRIMLPPTPIASSR